MEEKPIVLVAEDDDSSFMLLRLLLRDEYQVVRAVNGLEAVKTIRKRDDIDLVLMDVRMPRMNGIEALRQIRSFNVAIPIIMQTANAFDTDREEAIKAGCSGFLTKPIVFGHLRDMMKNLLGKSM